VRLERRRGLLAVVAMIGCLLGWCDCGSGD
jgi:hypothetical protein